MAVDVTPGDEFQAGRPAPFIDPWAFNAAPVTAYGVFPDGSFVIAVPDDDRSVLEQFGVTEFHVILNVFEELKGADGELKAQIPWLCLSVGRRGDRLV